MSRTPGAALRGVRPSTSSAEISTCCARCRGGRWEGIRQGPGCRASLWGGLKQTHALRDIRVRGASGSSWGSADARGWHPGCVSEPRKEDGVTENPLGLCPNLASRSAAQTHSRSEVLQPGNVVDHPRLCLLGSLDGDYHVILRLCISAFHFFIQSFALSVSSISYLHSDYFGKFFFVPVQTSSGRKGYSVFQKWGVCVYMDYIVDCCCSPQTLSSIHLTNLVSSAS